MSIQQYLEENVVRSTTLNDEIVKLKEVTPDISQVINAARLLNGKAKYTYSDHIMNYKN